MQILVVEDEPKVAGAVVEALQQEGYDAVHVMTGEEGFFLATTQIFDLIILDIMLPGRDGFEILQSLREQERNTPVLLLTARDTVEDRVYGLDVGADDYLVKPFALPELLARIRALTRRGRPDDVLRLKAGDLKLDCVSKRVSRRGMRINLTSREFELLEYMMRHAGYPVSRDMLARDVWKITERATPLDNVIDVHVSRLRAKIDTPFGSEMLSTIRGVGFILDTKEKK